MSRFGRSAFRSAMGLLASGLVAGALGCAGGSSSGGVSLADSGLVPAGAVGVEDLLVVDCLLPGQVRKLGRSQVYLTPRRPVKTSASDCEIRGGEYIGLRPRRLPHRAARLARRRQPGRRPSAELRRRDLREGPRHGARLRARRASGIASAADQGFARAMTNLGQLYETGRGVDRDPIQGAGLVSKGLGSRRRGSRVRDRGQLAS